MLCTAMLPPKVVCPYGKGSMVSRTGQRPRLARYLHYLHRTFGFRLPCIASIRGTLSHAYVSKGFLVSHAANSFRCHSRKTYLTGGHPSYQEEGELIGDSCDTRRRGRTASRMSLSRM
jgi:hypothetical protein